MNPQFGDVPYGSWFHEPVIALMCNGSIDNVLAYWPERNSNRAEYLKTLLELAFHAYQDVGPDDWFTPYVKFAHDLDSATNAPDRKNLVTGGSLFRPTHTKRRLAVATKHWHEAKLRSSWWAYCEIREAEQAVWIKEDRLCSVSPGDHFVVARNWNMNYEEKKAKLLSILQLEADGIAAQAAEHQAIPRSAAAIEESQFFEQAQQDWEDLYVKNAELLVNRWDFGDQPERIAQVIASVAATLRSILLQTGKGVDAFGRIEGVEREPYFEVTVGRGAKLSAVRGDDAGADARVQVSGLEIAHDLEHRLNIDTETALMLWSSLANACEDWVKGSMETPLLPNLYLCYRNQSVTVELDQTIDFGLD